MPGTSPRVKWRSTTPSLMCSSEMSCMVLVRRPASHEASSGRALGERRRMVDMHTSTRGRPTVVACLVALTLSSTSCGSGDDPDSANPAPSASASPSDTATSTTPTPTKKASNPKPRGTMITSATSEFGEILWGPNRQVVYIWEQEPTDKAECYGDCAEAGRRC